MPRLLPLAIVLVALLPTLATARDDLAPRPPWLGQITSTDYDGEEDDLLTAGLGASGLGSPIAPLMIAATPQWMRRLAIYNNYRALVDTTIGGGYGSLYGPNIDANGEAIPDEGMIAGTEYLAYADDGSGRQNVTLMVQVPQKFDVGHPCIVATASPGSRGVYGAIGNAGEWGLKHGCAVAHADKGTGNGIHDLQADTVSLQDGLRMDAREAGKNANFSAPISQAQRRAYVQAFPGRHAFKHAHSQQNPEQDWGRNTLQALQFAFYVLNQQFKLRLDAANTLTIAAGVSNGGGAVLAAAEQDTQGLIKGVVAAEPNLAVAPDAALRVTRGKRSMQGGRNLLDYTSFANLYQACAALADPSGNAFNTVLFSAAQARCDALAAASLISGASYSELGQSAQRVLLDFGYEAESAPLHAAMFSFASQSLVATFANAYGRFSVLDNLCSWSFAGPSALLPLSFALGNGVPPTLGVELVKNGEDGQALSLVAIDYDLPGAQCARALVTGNSEQARRVQEGMRQVQRGGNLHGRPALIVHGRADTLIPVGFSSRPYLALNRQQEGVNSKLRYIEVTNAQHFDAFLPLPGFGENYIPLNYYFHQAMDLMYAHLRRAQPLPESQVLHTFARGRTGLLANPISSANVPAIPLKAKPGNRIVVDEQGMVVPD